MSRVVPNGTPPSRASIGITLPPAAFPPGATLSADNLTQSLHNIMLGLRPVLVTTVGDVPASTDIKLLANVGDAIRRQVLEIRSLVFMILYQMK